MTFGLMALVTVVMHMVSAQDGSSTVIRQGTQQSVNSEIITPRTRASLSCKSGDMVVSINFTQPFRGLIYAHRSRTSPCRVFGTGGTYYVLRIPLKGCGTWQESSRVFVNNITIRFHPALELEEDETKTIVCRYPPPLTPAPSEGIHIIEPVSPTPNETTQIRRARLSQVEILIIICLLLFLSLLILGIGIAYFCLKRRNIHLVRRKPLSSGPASQLTKLSNSMQPSVLSGAILNHTVMIPRVVPYSASLRTQTVSDHHYDDANTPSSAVISRDSLESSPSTSTTTGDSSDGTTHLLHHSRDRVSTAMTIPKAVLRKDDKRKISSSINQHVSIKNSVTTSAKKRDSQELEDQTVTTVLEPESSDSSNNFEFRVIPHSSSYPAPVYALVDKKKQRVKIAEKTEMLKFKSTDPSETVLFDSKTTRNTAPSADVASSPHSKEKVLPREHENFKRKKGGQPNIKSSIKAELPSKTPEKSLCIQDISDVFVTTTIETKSTEVKTTLSRDITEEHVKESRIPKSGDISMSHDFSKGKEYMDSNRPPDGLTKKTYKELKFVSFGDDMPHDPLYYARECEAKFEPSFDEHHVSKPSTSKKENTWNVIIRQRKPLTSHTTATTECKPEDFLQTAATSSPPPRFDVKIITKPPKQPNSDLGRTTERRESMELVNVPQLQMPHSIEKLRQITSKLESLHAEAARFDAAKDSSKELDDHFENVGQQLKTVKWSDDREAEFSTYSAEPVDKRGSLEIGMTETGLQERSFSEVLHKAPMLSADLRPDHFDQQNSSTTITSSSEDKSSRTKNVPVFESYSPEFLSDIPVVIQGGFFHSEPSKDVCQDTKTPRMD